jgi:hypothetical protein
MSDQLVRADESLAAVRSLYNDNLSSIDDVLFNTRTILSMQYAGMCWESPGYVPGENGDYYVTDPGAESRFSQSLRDFRAYLGNNSFNIGSDYIDFLDGGRNCPDGSPGYLRANVGVNFEILAGILSNQSEKFPPDSSEGSVYLAARDQAQKLKSALESGRSFSPDMLDVLKEIAEILYSPEFSLRGAGLLSLILWDENGLPIFPPYFDSLVSEAAFENTGWRSDLQSILNEVGDADSSTARGIGLWTIQIYEKNSASAEQDPIFRTLLLLLDDGEADIVKRFLRILTGSPPSPVYPLIYTAASQKLTYSKRQIVERALRIAESSSVDSKSDSELISEIALLIRHPQLPFVIESEIAVLLDKVLESRISNGVLNGPNGASIAAGIIRKLNAFCSELAGGDYKPDEWEDYILNQPEAMLLLAGAYRNLDDLDVRLLKEALNASPPWNWDGEQSAWRYIMPLLNPEIDSVIRVDFDPKAASWDEHFESFLNRYYHMEKQYVFDGKESFLPFARPSPEDSNLQKEIEPARLEWNGPPMDNFDVIVSSGQNYMIPFPCGSMTSIVAGSLSWSVSTTWIMGAANFLWMR